MLKHISKLREQLFIYRNVKKSLSDLENELLVHSGRDYLAICPTATDNSWQGIYAATKGLFGEAVFNIPQYYSQQLYSDNELKNLAVIISKLSIKQVILSGYYNHFNVFVKELSRNGVSVSIIYHGSHASVSENPAAADHFKDFLELSQKGIISKVGLVKKDLDKTFNKLTGLKCFPIHLKTDESLLDMKVEKLRGINIGALTHSHFRKNLYNQVSAALLVENSIVHMKEYYKSYYLGNQDRIKLHGFTTDRTSFLKLLGSMSVNLYVTFSECWGQFINESLLMGVPCLASDVSAVLDFDDEIKKRLVVREFDNDYAIYLKIMEVMEDIQWYEQNGPKYIQKVNQVAEQTLQKFIVH